jgi:hypothetical protein
MAAHPGEKRQYNLAAFAAILPLLPRNGNSKAGKVT